MGWGRKRIADIFRALKFNGCPVRRDVLRTQRKKLPPFTLSPETVKREGERKVFSRKASHNIPNDKESGECSANDPQSLDSGYVLGSCDMKDRNLDE
jgi:hypothetical protein